MDTQILVATVLGTLAVWSANYAASYISQQRPGEVFDIGYALAPQKDVPGFVHFGYTYLPLIFLPFFSTTAAKITAAVTIRMVALTALKALTTVTTILPKQEPCDEESTKKFSLHMLFSGQCYEKVFSGYMAFAVLVSLAFVANGVWPLWAGWLYSVGMAGILLVTRNHYTIDIIFGAALAYLSWQGRA